MHHFVSYSSADAEPFALKLADALEAGPPSIPPWVDKRKLRPGEDWRTQIDQAIRTCDTLVFVMSRDSVEANSICANEWSRAIKFKKPIVPVRIDSNADLPFGLEERHYIDFSANFDVGLARLRQYLQWLPTPPGQLQSLRYRLADAQRDLRRVNDADRPRVEREIEELKGDIARRERIIKDLNGAIDQIKESIDSRIKGERQPTPRTEADKRAKFVNPPPPLSPEGNFKDRIAQTEFVVEFLKADSVRMITLVGRGGVGKTAMVCRLLKGLERGIMPDDLGEFEVGGIVYLSEVGTHRIGFPNVFGDLCRLLAPDVAARLGEVYKDSQLPVRSKMFSLLEEFQEKPVVLLLDNLETIIDPETRTLTQSDLREALQAMLEAPHHVVKTIITTRIPPQDVLDMEPQRQQTLPLSDGLDSPYAELLLRALDKDGSVGLKNAPDSVLDLVRQRTRGFPKALEAFYGVLYADRSTTLEELLAETQHALPDKVVEKLVGEHFSRLDKNAQMVMQALAIYSRPVPPVAVDFLLQPFDPTVDSAQTLRHLVNMHFVRKEAGRYSLHPIDHEYSLARIAAVPNPHLQDGRPDFTQQSLRRLAADYFRLTVTPRDSWKTKEDLDPQLNEFELRCAAGDAGDYEVAASVLLSVDYRYLYFWGHFQKMVDLHSQLRGKVEDRYYQQQSLGHLGIALADLGRIAEAREVTEQALRIAKDAGLGNQVSVWLGNLGTFDSDTGNTVNAVARHEEALADGVRLGSSWLQAVALGNLGGCYGDLGQISKAQDSLEEAVSFAHLAADAARESVILGYLAELLVDAENFSRAKKTATTAIEIATLTNVKKALTLGHKARVLANLFGGDLATARVDAEAACQLNLPQYKHTCLVLLGLVALRQQDTPAAQQFLSEAVAEADKVVAHNPRQFRAWDTRGLALAALTLSRGQADFVEAIAAHQRAREIAMDAGVVARLVRLYRELESCGPRDCLVPVRQAAGGNS